MTNYGVEVTGRYEGGLRVRAVHGPSGAELVTDAPLDNEGQGAAFSPTDLVGTALGTCVMTIMGILAARRGLDLTGSTFRVRKEMAADPDRRIGRLTVDFELPAALSAADRTALERAAHACPVHRSLAPNVDAPLSFTYSR